MCVAANSDTGAGSDLLTTIPTTRARDNAPVVVRDLSASCIQGSHRDTPQCYEGCIGSIDKTGSGRNERSEANTGIETSDITEVVLIVTVK